MIDLQIYLFRWCNVRRCTGLSIYIAPYTYTKYTIYTLNLHLIYTCFIVYFTLDKKTGEIHLLFDIWMNLNITSKNTPEWTPGTPARSVDTKRSSPFTLMKEMFLLMNHAAVVIGSVAVIIWHLRNISRHIQPMTGRTLQDGSSRNRLKFSPYLIFLPRYWLLTLTGPAITCSVLWLKNLEMMRQTVSLVLIT